MTAALLQRLSAILVAASVALLLACVGIVSGAALSAFEREVRPSLEQEDSALGRVVAAPIETALSLCTDAAALGLPAHRLVVGASADLVALDAETPAEAVALRPVRRLVMKAGVILAREGRYEGK